MTNIDILKNNSLNEATIATDIADTDEIVSGIIDQKFIDSLAYQICDVQPIHGPTGAVFAVTYDTAAKKTELKRINVTVEDDTTTDTGFTSEAIKDMQSQFGKSALGFITKAFAGTSSAAENLNLTTKMLAWAKDDGALTLTVSQSAETKVFEISQKVAENVLKLNEKNYRTLDAYCILPQSAAASFLALGSYFSDDQNESGLFIGKTGRIKYYVNPDVTVTEAIVGLKSAVPGGSSVVMSPYQHAIITAIDPDSGETKAFNINRYAITQSPLSEVDNEILRKFTIA